MRHAWGLFLKTRICNLQTAAHKNCQLVSVCVNLKHSNLIMTVSAMTGWALQLLLHHMSSMQLDSTLIWNFVEILLLQPIFTRQYLASIFKQTMVQISHRLNRLGAVDCPPTHLAGFSELDKHA